MGKELGTNNAIEIKPEVIEMTSVTEQSIFQLSELSLTLVGGGGSTVTW
jgi:hypothetical protein